MRQLFPKIQPNQTWTLQRGSHQVYLEESGNPAGIPVLFLHGGPGSGCIAAHRRFFDPEAYRIILFDQRGCGRSRPHANVESNTTWHLVADIENIRTTLGIDQWVVFGGSWGATLGLIYSQTHPDRVLHLVLRGVFLMTAKELQWFYGGGAGQFWPDVWRKFTSLIPEDEQNDLIAAYNKRLFSGDLETETRHARAWASWENALASISNDGSSNAESPAEYARAFARLENHYFLNRGFLDEDGQILRDVAKLDTVSGTIVQGRYDMICPPVSAYELHRNWPKSDLMLVPRAGHALSEPGISKALVETTDRIVK